MCVTTALGVEAVGHVFEIVKSARPVIGSVTVSCVSGAMLEWVIARFVQLPGVSAFASNVTVSVLPLDVPGKDQVITVPLASVVTLLGAGLALS